MVYTVDGSEVGSLSMFIPLFIGFHTSQVVNITQIFELSGCSGG